MGTGKPCLAALLGVRSLGILGFEKRCSQRTYSHSKLILAEFPESWMGLVTFNCLDCQGTPVLTQIALFVFSLFYSCFLLRSSTVLRSSSRTHFSTYNKIPTLTIISTDVTILTVKFCVLMLGSVYGSYLITALELGSAQIWPWNCRWSLVPVRYTWWAEAETERHKQVNWPFSLIGLQGRGLS